MKAHALQAACPASWLASSTPVSLRPSPAACGLSPLLAPALPHPPLWHVVPSCPVSAAAPLGRYVLQISSCRGCLCLLPGTPSRDHLCFLLHRSTAVLFSALLLETKGVWWFGVLFFPMKNASHFFVSAIMFKNLKEAYVKKHS